MSRQADPVREGLARGWKVLGGPHGALPARIDCDVAIVGSGAGAGITAELLTQAGLQVVLVEEGCFDRSPLSHKVNLFDLHHKYADVMHVDAVVAQLAGPAVRKAG